MASKSRLQEQGTAQELLLDSDSDEQLSEDKDISRSVSDTDAGSDREIDNVQTDDTQWTDCTQT
jgi:hypothetical protein